MICPSCKEDFCIAYIGYEKDKPHREKIECPKCHKLWENPSNNHCIHRDDNGICTHNDCPVNECSLGYEHCLYYCEKPDKPAIGIAPAHIVYPKRIRELSQAISRYSDKAEEHCVYEWLNEIYLIRILMRGMKQKEFSEEELMNDEHPVRR